MREQLRDRERLEHMLAAIDRIIRYTAGKTYVDNVVVWDVVSNELSVLRKQITQYLSEFD